MRSLSNPAVRRAIIDRIGTLLPDDSARWGRMSVHQMLCHLNDACRYALGAYPAKALPVPVPRPIYRWVALHTPVRWPRGIQAPPEMAAEHGGTPPLQFESDRAALLDTLQQFCAALPEPPRPHPYFGQMTPSDWMRWGYLHTDHHLRQFGR